MEREELLYWITLSGAVCWAICFWWMYRISRKQNALLAELREQAERIEKLSKEEHRLMQEVHPQVGEIKDGIAEMAKTLEVEG